MPSQEKDDVVLAGETDGDVEKLSIRSAATETAEAKPAALTAKDAEEGKEYPKLRKVVPILGGIFLALFLICLVSRPNHQTEMERIAVTNRVV